MAGDGIARPSRAGVQCAQRCRAPSEVRRNVIVTRRLRARPFGIVRAVLLRVRRHRDRPRRARARPAGASPPSCAAAPTATACARRRDSPGCRRPSPSRRCSRRPSRRGRARRGCGRRPRRSGSRARGLSDALSNRNSTSAASVTFTCVRGLVGPHAVVERRRLVRQVHDRQLDVDTRPPAPRREQPPRRLAQPVGDRDIGERLDARHHDVDRRDGLGRRGERRLEVDGRVLARRTRALRLLLHTQRPVDSRATRYFLRPSGSISATPSNTSPASSPSESSSSWNSPSLNVLAIWIESAGLSPASDDRRVEHDRRAAALELGDEEDEAAAVGAARRPARPDRSRRRRRGVSVVGVAALRGWSQSAPASPPPAASSSAAAAGKRVSAQPPAPEVVPMSHARYPGAA